MRTFALVITLVAALTAPALADDDPDGDPAYQPFPRRSIAVGMQGQTAYIDGRSESGIGASLELAIGRGRWQYFGEASIGSAELAAWTSEPTSQRDEGRLTRGAAGMRWLARQFQFDRAGGIELFLLSAIGAQRFAFDERGTLTRPEVSLGVGLLGRSYRKPRIGLRMDLRAVFTPNEMGSSTGFSTGFAVTW